MRNIIYSLIVFSILPITMNGNILNEHEVLLNQQNPTYFEIFNHVEKISSDIFKSKPDASMYIYTDMNG